MSRPSSDETRLRLLRAALDVFGRQGFDASTTRQLAATANANLQSITYHFGGKEGLYQAAAEYLSSQVRERVQPVAEVIGDRVASGEVGKEEARDLVTEIFTTLAELLMSPESEPWARFIVREQMEPSPAFEHIYEEVMQPLAQLMRQLFGVIMEEETSSEHVALKVFALFGQVLALRVARTALLRTVGWDDFDESGREAICESIAESVANLRPRSEVRE